MMWIIIIPVLLLLLITFLFNCYVPSKKHSQFDKYYNILLILLTSLPATFLGAYWAVDLSIEQSENQIKNQERTNYQKLLLTSIKSDEYYIDETEKIILFLDALSPLGDKYNSSIDDVKNQFILEEIIKNGYLYKYSSEKFTNWLTTILAEIRKNDFSITKSNKSSFLFLRDYLRLKEEFLKIETEFLDSNYTETKMDSLYDETLSRFLISRMDDDNNLTLANQLHKNGQNQTKEFRIRMRPMTIDSAINKWLNKNHIGECYDSTSDDTRKYLKEVLTKKL